jgi:8-amino-7-oxononanoate synthase
MKTPEQELGALAAAGLLRGLRALDSGGGPRVTRDGRELWNFAANDYLGLATHPALAEAFAEGVKSYGSGAAASRLVCGTLPPHRRLEEALAEAKGGERALTFSSGFAAALGTVTSVVGKGDVVILDKLSHACLIDGAKLSGATIRVFPHNDMGKLGRLLSSARASLPVDARILVITESVFSMDGDRAPLAGIVELKERFGALLLLDEAHGFGVLGPRGMGLAESLGLQSHIDFQMGTLSKAAGLAGGFIVAKSAWVDLLVNRARSLIYSTAPPPALAHAACASLALIRSAEGSALREQLRNNLDALSNTHAGTPILPYILGGNEAALAASRRLEDMGYMVPAIRYPTVPRGSARLRVSVSAAHGESAIAGLRQALREAVAGVLS